MYFSCNMYLKLVETQTSQHFTRNFESEKAAMYYNLQGKLTFLAAPVLS